MVFCDSFSSVPTRSPSSCSCSYSSSSSSPPSSSVSLDASLLLDFADDLWFYRSVVPFPSLSTSCLPTLCAPSPDPSTLIAQCMITDLSASSQRSLVSSSSTLPAPDSKPLIPVRPTYLSAYDSLPAPPSIHEIYANTFSEHDEIPYGGDYGSSGSDRDVDMYRAYLRSRENKESDYYYTASIDLDEEDAYHGYHVASDGENEEGVSAMKFAYERYRHDESDDALSGINDVGGVLKGQHQRWTGIASHARMQREAGWRGSYLQQKYAQSRSGQKELKENLKLWAHVVVSTRAKKARPLL